MATNSKLLIVLPFSISVLLYPGFGGFYDGTQFINKAPEEKYNNSGSIFF